MDNVSVKKVGIWTAIVALVAVGLAAVFVPLGNISVSPSGDTSGATDLARIQAAINAVAASKRLPPSFSQNAATAYIQFQPGTFYLTASIGNILGSANTSKIQGIVFECSGKGGVTTIDYNPGTSAPLFTNNHGLEVEFRGCTFEGHDTGSDFLWSQEQAGVTNVQDYVFVDDVWQGTWQSVMRLTGGNNNSEWKFTRSSVAGSVANWIYVPPQVATTITSSSSTIAATNTSEQVEVGDTGFFTSACAPLSANTQYYVVAAGTTSFQVSTSFGGSPTTFTANCTPAFQTGNDQFLNFWFDKAKFDTGTSNADWINMAYGGSIKIRDSDVSGHSPASGGSCLFVLGTTTNNGVHNSGIENFEADGLRVEHSNNYSCTIISNWWRGSVSFNNLDESSQAGNRTISNVYATYNFYQNGGPTVKYTNSQLMGTHAYNVQSNTYTYKPKVSYDSVTLYDNPTFANFIVMSGTNTGGWPVIDCDHCRNTQVSSVVGYQEIVDTSLNWQYQYGGVIKTRTAICLGAQSNWPTGGGVLPVRLPLNAAITQFRWWKNAGSSNTGAYSYSLQSTEATPTVVAGPFTGTASSSAIALQTTYGTNGSTLATATPFVMTTDAARTVEIIDNQSRSGAFGSGLYCLIDYIG